MCAATQAAREAAADLLIAVGGGSVIVATRAVAIFLAEPGDPFDIMTQYPEGKPAYSPRLLAPKPPIINIPTTPTSAMNRAGTGLKNPDLDHRMEYFDPKTRPQAIFLDEDALLSAPPDLMRSTATTVFASPVGAMARPRLNPLVEGDRNQAFRLAYRAYPRLTDEPEDASLRIDLCIAAFLQNRAEDDGFRRSRGGAFAGNYAVSTALHVRYPHVGQGESTSVVHAAKIRLSETVDMRSARQVAEALGVWRDGMDCADGCACRGRHARVALRAHRRPDAAAPARCSARGPRSDRQRDGEELQRQRRRAFARGSDRGCDALARGGLLSHPTSRANARSPRSPPPRSPCQRGTQLFGRFQRQLDRHARRGPSAAFTKSMVMASSSKAWCGWSYDTTEWVRIEPPVTALAGAARADDLDDRGAHACAYAARCFRKKANTFFQPSSACSMRYIGRS